MVEIFADETYAPLYIETMERILNGVAQEYEPAGIYITRIQGWFDYKWLRFSGKVYGELAVWKTPLTLPPFNPSRVLSQRYLHWRPEEGNYARATSWVHLARGQQSSDNLKCCVSRAGNSLILVWFCSGTMATGRGSLMVYVHTPRQQTSWFVSLDRKNDGWRKTANSISLKEIERLESVGRQEELEPA